MTQHARQVCSGRRICVQRLHLQITERREAWWSWKGGTFGGREVAELSAIQKHCEKQIIGLIRHHVTSRTYTA